METVVISVAMITSICGNLLTIVTMLLRKNIQTVPNIYIASLGLSDLLISGILIPYWIASLWISNDGDMEASGNHVESGPPGCGITAFIWLLLTTIALYNICAISINRFVVVTQSKKAYMSLYTHPRVIISLATIWILPVLLFVIPYSGMGKYGYNTHQDRCLFVEQDHHKTYWYILASDIVGPVATFFLTMICHLKIMHHFQRSRQRIEIKMAVLDENSTFPSSSINTITPCVYKGKFGSFASVNGSNNSIHTQHIPTVKIIHQRKPSNSFIIAKNLILPWTFLIVFRLPLVIIHILDYREKVSALYHHIGAMLVLIAPAADFIIYALLNRQMRQTFKSLLLCKNSGKYIPH